MQQIILQPQTPDELHLVKQFAKVMKIKATTLKETPKARKKREILDSIERGLAEIKLHQEGKITLKSAREVLDEL
ncbi:hypothetical protein EXU85_00210 [Spirosoma sp. KCTC 42546]|uniref:hypothetical protein n=1 Tax=Spirosoma sp. KCTC 42546 TaxID=2520506 RepID=UPI0011576A27|nr:hypothetical protein [Spirosoma sp. KCTC 42546]QDK77101.1 hypothetical protein EXU85_00210 [Spirosoma sp. KCTC 42546]